MQTFNKNLNDNFYKWFDNSKGIDSNGIPEIFYHKSRSKEKFNIFKYDEVSKNQFNNCHGFYFVGHYHKHYVESIGDGLEYYVYLKMINPFYIFDDGRGKIKDMLDKNYDYLDINVNFCHELINNGHDSIIIMSPIYYNQYIVFNSNQIKSIDNDGNYSIDELDIFK